MSSQQQHSAAGSGWWLLILPGLIWGASFLFIAEALHSVNPNGLTFLRICFGFVTLAFFPAARKAQIARKDWAKVFWLGVLWFGFPMSMFPFAEQLVTSALTGMLNGANPLFATIAASIIARRAPSRGVATGLAIGLFGTVLIALSAIGEGSNSVTGISLVLIAVSCYGVALNLARALQLEYGAIPVIWRAQAVAVLITAPLGIPDVLRANWTPIPFFSLLALGSLGTAIANVLMASAAGRFGAARASGATFLIPVVALILGVVVRHEQVALLSVAGCFVSLLGAWFMKRASTH